MIIKAFGGSSVVVRETPAILGEVNAEALIRDVADKLSDQGDSDLVQAQIEAILSRIACHGSIRSGRRMRAAYDEVLATAVKRSMNLSRSSAICSPPRSGRSRRGRSNTR